jgi:predicted MFS family arabinose efflux permease
MFPAEDFYLSVKIQFEFTHDHISSLSRRAYKMSAAGGMVVAAVQSSIAAGAALGGLLFGISGVTSVFITAGCIMLFATLVIGLKVRVALT